MPNYQLISTAGGGASGYSGYSGSVGPDGISGYSGFSGDSATAVPAGSDTQVQYNNSGSFGADTNFIYDYINQVLKVNGEISSIGGIFSFNGLDSAGIDYTSFSTMKFQNHQAGGVNTYEFWDGGVLALIVGHNGVGYPLVVPYLGGGGDKIVGVHNDGSLYSTTGGAGTSGYSGYSGVLGTSGYSGYSGSSGTSGYSGYSGYSGKSGYSGYSGASGTSGYSGYSGVGTSGYSGYSGSSGTSGYSGYSGKSGYSGYSGTSGTSGYSGYSGASGTSGYSGYSGKSGYSGYSGVSGFSGTTPNPLSVITLIETPQTLTDAATIGTNAANGSFWRVTLGGNRTLGNPTGATDGQILRWQIIQDGTGSRTITLDTAFQTGPLTVTLSTAANAVDYLSAIYYSSTSKFHVLGFIKGYS